jgi:hypothetical protein
VSNKHLIKEDTKIANKHMKRCLTSLVTTMMKYKPQNHSGILLRPIRMAMKQQHGK